MTYDPNRPLNTAATEREIDRTADKTNDAINKGANKANDAINSTANKASSAVSSATDKASSAVSNAADKASSAVSSAADTANDLKDKATQVAGDVQAKAADVAGQAADRADAATTTAGAKIQDAAQLLRDKAPSDGAIGQAATATADTLDRAGSYLQQQDLSGMRGDFESLVRNHPTESLLIAFGVGFLLARGTRR